jgi:AraC family transcriptional activator of pobA
MELLITQHLKLILVFSIDQMEKPSSSYVNMVADKEIKDSFSISPIENHVINAQVVHRTTYNRMFLIIAGVGNLKIDDRIFPVSGGELILIAKGQVYAFTPNTSLSGYELCFGDCFWEKAPASASNCKAVLFNNASANQHIPLSDNDLSELLSLYSILFREFIKGAYINKLDALAAYLKIIMIKVANMNAALIKGYDNYENQLYRQFLELISKQYKDTHEVAEFARQLGVSARKLAELCNRISGKGAKEIINGQIIAEAKRTLQFSSRPVKEIAYYLNFSSPDQFSHFFKKNTQISPDHYRAHFVQIGM